MGWNGSGKLNSSSGEEYGASRRAHYTIGKRAAICVLLVLCCVVVAWLFLSRDKPSGQIQEKKEVPRSALAEVKPSQSKKPTENKKKYADWTRDEKLAYYRNKYGDNLPENLKPIVYYLENPPQRKFEMPKRPEGIFKHHSERTIASFLMVKPGTWMMRPIEFGAKFDADFAAALAEQIEFSDDDTDEQRELKTAVIETKKELAERIKNGEKASEVLTETAKQLYELGQYRSDLESQIKKIRKDASMSDQDVQDAVNAANQMLKAKGLPPLKMPNMLIRHVTLKRAAKKAAEQPSQEK